MTKQHFIAFANEIRLMDADDATKRAAAKVVVEVARQFNGRFDVDRFLKACGL